MYRDWIPYAMVYFKYEYYAYTRFQKWILDFQVYLIKNKIKKIKELSMSGNCETKMDSPSSTVQNFTVPESVSNPSLIQCCSQLNFMLLIMEVN